MGTTCSRRMPTPSWERVQEDFSDSLSPTHGRHKSEEPRRSLAVASTGDLRRKMPEVALEHALSTRDPLLIRRACDEAENHVAITKLTLARAEARWLESQAALQEALQSGDARRIQQASRAAERAGLEVQNTPRIMDSEAPSPFSFHALGQFFSGRVTVLAAVLVLTYEWSAYNFVYIGRILPIVGKDYLAWPFLLIFNCLWGLAVASFLRAWLSDPGFVPGRWYDFVRVAGNSLPVAPARLEWQPCKATSCKRCQMPRPERAHHCHATSCKRCQMPRPERAHHCHVCERCVMRMDHHCPWINNCVGIHNHKFFILLIVYSLLSCTIGVATSISESLYCAGLLWDLVRGRGWQSELQFADVFAFSAFTMLALLFGGLLWPMAVNHIELLSYNMTTIEGHYDHSSRPNPFDQGDAIDNASQVFGRYGIEWFLPVRPSRPLSDGVVFTSGGEAAGLDADVGQDWRGEEAWRVRYQVRGPLSVGATESQRRRASTGLYSWFFGSQESAAGDQGLPRVPGAAVSNPRRTYFGMTPVTTRVLSI